MQASGQPLYQQPIQPAASAFKTFEDLQAYQVAREFRKAMYDVARRLPEVEKFGLASQMRRAAISLTNNIAEGHGRYHYLDQVKFCLQGRGSLEELLDDLNVCEDERYLVPAEIAPFKQQGWRVHQLLNGYIRWLRERKQGAALTLHESSQPCGSTEDELDLIPDTPAPVSTLQHFNPSTPPK